MRKVNYKNFDEVQVCNYDAIVVGCGFAGSVVARQLSESGKNILIIEKRNHVAGNMFDSYDKYGVLIHNYGPHIFHTNILRVYEYLCKFSDMRPYEHRVKANVHGTLMPVPFNKTSMEIAFGNERAKYLTDKLIDKFGDEVKVTINELRAQDDHDLKEIADYVYENIFLHYTMKQWGVTPDEVDPSVTARVPLFISRDDRYFQDKYQYMPAEGYTKLFENMLSHKNITVCLNTEAEKIFNLNFYGDNKDANLESITIQNKKYDGYIVFTGPLDELFQCRYGGLPYRSLDFVYENLNKEFELPCGSVNYTTTDDFTRITEFKHLSGQKCAFTTIMREYSKAYEDAKNQTPYYAILSEDNKSHYEQYLQLTSDIDNFYAIGRLAEYKYYNMDQIIDRALDLSEELLSK